jgi:purine-binding chemotaxis protein CheW
MQLDEHQRRKALEQKLQGILGQLADVCGQLGIDLSPAPYSPPAPPAPSPPPPPAPALQPCQVLLAQVDTLALGFVSTQVQELARMVALAPSSDPRPEIEGYVNVRGAAVPVVNLRVLLGLPTKPHDVEQFLVFLRAQRSTLAVVVDEVQDIFDVTAEQIQDRNALDLRRGLLQGVIHVEGRLVGVIDPARLVAQAL